MTADVAPRVVMQPPTTFRFRTPAEVLPRYITPADGVFVLAHFGIPRLQAGQWRLEIEGLVDRPMSLSLDEVMALPKRSIEAFIKCAGMPADPTVATRNVSNANWGGASLKSLLDAAGLRPEVTHLWACAPDHGTYDSWSSDGYQKDFPVARLAPDDVLLVYELNGEPLSAEHGAPLRLFIPGFYGTNSVKWLTKIVAADRRAPGTFTNELYNDPSPGRPVGSTETRPVYEAPPEAFIIEPRPDSTIDPRAVRVAGWCWGAKPIAFVEVSVDLGRTWIKVDVPPRRGCAWQPFECFLTLARDTEFHVWAKATDEAGETQPLEKARNSVHQVRFRTGRGD
jgi:sulfane dehydrogenase subunit SoxC